MSEFAIDKAILDEMMKYNQMEPVQYVQYALQGETTFPDPLEPFKRVYKDKYSVESGSPQVFAPESMADDLFEIYKGLESNEREEAMKFLKQENKIVEDYFKQNPKKDPRKKMI
tara:strand:+ start:1170 stop:1511 length:342 start_codon:yes stop_codon:yes gene_type:complete